MAAQNSLFTNLRGLALITPWLSWLFVADTSLSLLLLAKPLAPRLVYDVSSQIAATVWHWVQGIFVRSNGANITTSGDVLPHGESAIVVCNHVAWPDFYMIQAVASQAGMLGRCRYFAKRALRYVPFLGWGLWAMGMPMISRDWLRDKTELNRVFRHIVNDEFPTWLVSFSESTRFSPAKLAESEAWCKKMDRPQPMHLLYPRTKGFVATVHQLRNAPHIKAVYDLTIAYQQGDSFQTAPTMWETLSKPGLSDQLGHRFHVHVRRFPIESLPEEDNEIASWLEQVWVEKGVWLEEKRLEWESKVTE